jgi:cytochrome c oxidase assembly protein subunit 15
MANPVSASALRPDPWLCRFAVFTAAATLVLICFGGLVTSHGAGLAVPDWPNTYGYSLFFFPISKWVGGIFYEHTHRLAGAAVGLLTLILAGWLWRKESRAWLRWLGVLAFVGVVLQGVLGGLRVVLLKDQIGLVHGALAQLFFVLVCLIALATSRWWLDAAPAENEGTQGQATLRRWVLAATLLVLGQLVLGAAMRHRHAGLAVPDFPLAYGRLWPRTDTRFLARYNQQREEIHAMKPITASDVLLQMTHRLGACVVAAAVAGAWWIARRRLGPGHVLRKSLLAWLGLVAVQVGLGAATVWTAKSADLATAHVAVGSLILALGGLQTAAAFRLFAPPRSRDLTSAGDLATPTQPNGAIGQPVHP